MRNPRKGRDQCFPTGNLDQYLLFQKNKFSFNSSATIMSWARSCLIRAAPPQFNRQGASDGQTDPRPLLALGVKFLHFWNPTNSSPFFLFTPRPSRELSRLAAFLQVWGGGEDQVLPYEHLLRWKKALFHLQWELWVQNGTSVCWKSSDRVTLAYSERFCCSKGCHCKRAALYL